MDANPKPLWVADLGLRNYHAAWELQKTLVARRQQDEIADTLLLVEHPHVITLGRGAHAAQNVLAPGDMSVVEIERGGDVTYHGPGQLVGYPIFKLEGAERDLHKYLRNIEEALIVVLRARQMAAERRPGLTGVWVGEHKVASIGVAVRRWVTLHGFALNVTTDLTRFSAISPCGLAPEVMASVESLTGHKVPLGEIGAQVAVAMAQVFGRQLGKTPEIW